LRRSAAYTDNLEERHERIRLEFARRIDPERHCSGRARRKRALPR
jgi:hypothetical protein